MKALLLKSIYIYISIPWNYEWTCVEIVHTASNFTTSICYVSCNLRFYVSSYSRMKFSSKRSTFLPKCLNYLDSFKFYNFNDSTNGLYYFCLEFLVRHYFNILRYEYFCCTKLYFNYIFHVINEDTTSANFFRSMITCPPHEIILITFRLLN